SVWGGEPFDLLGAPFHPLAELAREDPVEREVRADHRVGSDRRVGRVALLLARPCRDIARARERPGADHAPGVEVVALVPTVVRDFVPEVRLDHREQRAAELDRLLARVAGTDWLDRRLRGPLSSP